MPMIKAQLTDEKNSAFMWLNQARECPTGFAGALYEAPKNLLGFQEGQTISVSADQILDWMVNHNGLLYGGFSIRLIRDRKPANERAQFDEYMGVAAYEPLPT